MRNPNWILPTLLASALLVACGGGDDKVQFTSVVSFGDSVSDVGTYKVGTIEGLGGGKFTVNGAGGSVWSEFLAASVRAPAQCAAQTGMLPNNGAVGAAVQNFAGCHNYAQGSSRVSSSGTGPNGVALQAAFGEQNLGFMAISLQQQFSAHLTKMGGTYKGAELVTVNGGGNDLFAQLSAVATAAGGGQTAVATGTVAGWSQATLEVVALGGQAAFDAAVAAGVGGMGQAGAELAGYVNTLVVGKGAKYVLVRNFTDLTFAPGYLQADAGTKGLMTLMIQTFNSQLKTGLSTATGVIPAGVILIDDYAQTVLIAANPGKYGYSNVSVQSCGPNAFGSPNGQSIVCNTTNLIAGDTSKYAFSDAVHPTPYSHQKSAETALALMVAAGWQ